MKEWTRGQVGRKFMMLVFSTLIAFVTLIVSGLNPYDRLTWFLEVMPIFVGYPILWMMRDRLKFTSLLYVFIAVHAVVLGVGGAYTYARVPFGYWIAEVFGMQRNPYDKIGHFFQGFVPALVAREVLIGGAYVSGRKMLFFIVVSIVLAISAAYELIEWGAALVLGQGADEFLGTQGDPWDTQSDMFLALVGAVFALIGFSKFQDAQVKKKADA